MNVTLGRLRQDDLGREGDAMSEPAADRGVLSDHGTLDLSHLRTPEDLAPITRIEDVGTVVIRESLAAAYAAIPSHDIGSTVYVPDDADVRVHTGPLIVGGDGIGAENDVLVVTGLLVITSPVTGVVPRRIHVMGAVVAPKGSESALGPVLGSIVGSVSYYRHSDNVDVKLLSGQVKLSGAMLANPAGTPDDLLLLAGQVIVSGPVGKIGYARIIVAGQLIAPASTQETLEPYLDLHGQVVWHKAATAWLVMDDIEVGADFFRLLDEPVSAVVLGSLTISPGVTEDAIREKVVDLTVLGDVVAPAEIVPILQVRATDVRGSIRVAGGPDE
ncbi:MAG TPA: hypothetical protein VJX10_18600 [Pseudonocardiaceae bacterium]|nr:hypothetical protein [Pseudonocardiaceae bacterium]